MRTIDLLIFIVYLVGIILLGTSFYKKNRLASDYSTGTGSLPSWIIGLSIFATYVSSISYLALPGIAFSSNWNTFVNSLTIPLALIVAVKFFVPLYRNIGSASAYAYMEQRFGVWARVYVASCYLLTQIMRTATILYLLALPLYVFFGWDMRLIILLTGMSVLLYSNMGGIKAVVWTDAIQSIILIAGAIITLIYIFISLPGGVGQYIDIGCQNDKFSLGSFGTSLSESTFWVVFVYGLFINLQNYGIDQNYVQRYMIARNFKEAVSSVIVGGLLYIPVSLIFFMIGTGLFVYFQVYPELLPVEFREPGMSDSVFPYYIVQILPVGLSGLLIASIFAAGMSTVSTSLNSGSTVFLTDFYKRIKKNASEKSSIRVLYITSAIIILLGIVIAFFMIKTESILSLYWSLAGIFSGGMIGLLLLGFFSKRVDNISAAIGVTLGLLVIVWMSLSPICFTGNMSALKSPFHNYLTIVFGTMVIFFSGFLVSLFVGKKTNKKI
ncbi:MAG: sodium:solute symporter [Tannerella sp.]|jgi:SSS family solute:Na+ symporter|nr:sodium:solute symporter [Tannerella sp.]